MRTTQQAISLQTREILQEMAEVVRAACIEAALEGYEMAAMNGLCHEGAWEAAISAMQTLELTPLLPGETKTEHPS